MIEAGRRLSLQQHERRTRACWSCPGRLQLHLEDDEGVVRVHELGPGEARHVPPGRIHRFEAREAVEVVEVSTPELDDVERLEDDYGREGTSAP